MNYCTACGAELIEGAEFCSKCGEKTVNSTTPIENKTQKPTPSEYSIDETKEKVSVALSSAKNKLEKNSYFNYFKETAKNPSSGVLAEGYNGWIHLAVLSIITAFATYALAFSAVKVAGGSNFYFGLGTQFFSSYINEILIGVFFQVLVASFVLYLVFILAIFLLFKRTSKQKERSFQSIVNQFSAFFTPNILMLFIVGLFTLVFSSELTLLLLLFVLFFSVVCSFLAYNFFISNEIKDKGWDQFYVFLGSNALILLAFAFIIAVQLQPMLADINQITGFF